MDSFDLSGKTIIVTGSNSGIGKHTALSLATRGARVIVACRNEQRGERACKEIQEKSANQNVIFRKVDLSSFSSTREFCRIINEEEARVDILINNAGVMRQERELAEDGNELVLTVNFLGPFLLTNLLLDKLRASAPSRIVNVASEMYERHPFDFDDVQSETSFDVSGTYGRSKSALMMTSGYLAGLLQGTGVTVHTLHPGVIQTRLTRNLPMCQNPCIRFLFPCIVSCLTCEIVSTESQGAQTTLYCALEPNLANQSGKHYTKCRERELKPHVTNPGDNRRVWELACNLCGIDVNQ